MEKIWVHDRIQTHNLPVTPAGRSHEPSKTSKLVNSLSVAQWLERPTGIWEGMGWNPFFFVPFFYS